jgi:hypothetical protein
MKRALRLISIGLALAAGPATLPAVLSVSAVEGITATASQALAQTSGRYSRPGGGDTYGGFDRRPSIGGGFGGPSASAFGGGGDLAISRRASSQALRNYRGSQLQPPALTTRRPSSGWDDGGWSTAPLPRRLPSAGWGGSAHGPGYTGSAARFGAWDAILAWSLLNSLSRPQSVAYFQENRNDPSYARWRVEAERKAETDPAVAQKLAELDTLMAQDTARTTSSRAVATEPGGSEFVIVVFFGTAVLIGLWMLRRRAAAVAGGTSIGTPRDLSAGPMPRGLSGSAATRFRVGMSFPVDPSPFLLAAGTTKVQPPEAGAMMSVEAVGLITDGDVALHRLYLPGRQAFFMLHLGRDGMPDECRYFSLLDQITPASQDEWGFWLDPAQGMIGWPQFQTKDGKLYDRVWAPGGARVAPRQQVETLQDLSGTIERRIQAMLYAVHTGAAPPAPGVEYVLVGAVEQGDEAWVEVFAGIDINPTVLTLPAVPPAN